MAQETLQLSDRPHSQYQPMQISIPLLGFTPKPKINGFFRDYIQLPFFAPLLSSPSFTFNQFQLSQIHTITKEESAGSLTGPFGSAQVRAEGSRLVCFREEFVPMLAQQSSRSMSLQSP
ncbi:hypothetical protein SUGI_1099880 [Cryptomeria japonica]|nr:hypothetical protein SUGI_1099880 [Cryptomeria japonica]